MCIKTSIILDSDYIFATCLEGTSLFEWCIHEGQAKFYRPSEDYYDVYESISTDESIVIPEVLGGSFEFKVEHIYDIC